MRYPRGSRTSSSLSARVRASMRCTSAHQSWWVTWTSPVTSWSNAGRRSWKAPPGPGSGRYSRFRCASVPSPLASSTLYRDRPGDLPAGQLATALMAADAAALALLYLGSSRHGAFADDMDGHAAYQMQVHQATGMVKIQLGVTIEEAFLMLRAHAFASGRPAAEVARDVVERRL